MSAAAEAVKAWVESVPYVSRYVEDEDVARLVAIVNAAARRREDEIVAFLQGQADACQELPNLREHAAAARAYIDAIRRGEKVAP